MSIVAPSLPEQGQLVSVRSRRWFVNDVRPSTLPPPALKPSFSGPQHSLTLSSVEDDGLGEELQVVWGIKQEAKVAWSEPDDFGPLGKLDDGFQATCGSCIRKLVTAVIYPPSAVGHKPQRPKVKGLYEENPFDRPQVPGGSLECRKWREYVTRATLPLEP
jgi:hypothetical protein